MRPSRKVRLTLSSALVALLASQTAPLAGPGTGEVAFRSLRTGNDELFRVPAAGGAPANVTNLIDRDLDPAWSRDGTRIAFARVPAGETQPSIFVMNADGSGLERVTMTAAADRHPTWSPNGNWLAFVRSFPPLGKSQIWKIRPNRSGLTRLTGSPDDAVPDDGLYGSPTWMGSSGALTVAFASDRAGGFPGLFSMSADGGTITQHTFDPNAIHANPDWADVGGVGTFAYEYCCPRGGADVHEVADVPGSLPVPMAADPALDEADPSFSPSVEDPPAPPAWLAYAQAPSAGGDRDVYTITRDGTATRTAIAPDPHADLSPDWSFTPPPPFPLAAPSGQAAARQEAAFQAAAGAGKKPGGASKKKPKGPRKVVEKVAPGIRLLMLRRAGPVQVFALRVDPKKQPAIDVALAQRRLAGLQKTSSMARQHGAIAAINGDFALPGGKPAHAFAEDGDLKQTSFMSGPTFALKRNQRSGFVADASLTLTSVETSSGDVWPVDRWNNGSPVYGEIAGYTASGAGIEDPPAYRCGARLVPTGPRTWGPAKLGIVRQYQVAEAGCSALALLAQGEEVALSAWAGSHEAFLLRSLAPGEVVSLTWSFGWSGVLEGIGGFPLLVASRQVVVGACGDLCGRAPRTGIGITSKGKVLLVVVDGRQPRWSRGMKLARFAKEMKTLGASFAMNLDGGGSSTMVVNRKVINRPSGAGQRRVSSAVLVLAAGDPGDSFAAAGPAAARAFGGAGRGYPGFFDPASTAGLLDALDEGAFGPRVPLPQELRRILTRFRQSR